MNTEQFDGHTPGPWALHTMGADEPYHSVHADGWGTWGIQTPITNGADARLIAAAPDLLAEVERLRACLLTYQPPEGFGWDDIHPRFSRDNWLSFVASQDDYEPGYWEWVNFQIVLEEDEEV